MKVDGLKELGRKLEKLDFQLQRTIAKEVALQSITPARDEAKRTAPIRTGKLAASIKSRGGRRKRSDTGGKAIVTTAGLKPRNYGPFVERGTKAAGFADAQPFMKPSIQREAPAIIALVAKNLGERISKEFAK